MSKYVIEEKWPDGENLKDQLVFDHGDFESEECVKNWGYEKAPVEIKNEGISWSFNAVTTSPRDGRIEWRGTVKGEKIKGSASWTRLDGLKMSVHFVGRELREQ